MPLTSPVHQVVINFLTGYIKGASSMTCMSDMLCQISLCVSRYACWLKCVFSCGGGFTTWIPDVWASGNTTAKGHGLWITSLLYFRKRAVLRDTEIPVGWYLNRIHYLHPAMTECSNMGLHILFGSQSAHDLSLTHFVFSECEGLTLCAVFTFFIYSYWMLKARGGVQEI